MSYCLKKNLGFTLSELLVTMAVMAIVLTVFLSRQSQYDDGFVLRNLADDVSLRIFQAQAYGAGVREFSPGSGEFSASYGLTFSLLDGGSDTAYLYFADRDGDAMYDGDWSCATGGTNECLERVDILRGVYIQEVCMIINPTSLDCGPPGTPRRVDISFSRPNTTAQLKFFNSGGGQFTNPNMIGAKIIFKSPNSTASSSVTIYTTGQVSTR